MLVLLPCDLDQEEKATIQELTTSNQGHGIIWGNDAPATLWRNQAEMY